MNPQNPITSAEIMARATALQDQIVGWRRTIHKQPELSFAEVKTARLVQSVLHDLGIEAETGVAKTGVVGHIEGAGPIVGLRADMDALPISEENGTGVRQRNTWSYARLWTRCPYRHAIGCRHRFEELC